MKDNFSAKPAVLESSAPKATVHGIGPNGYLKMDFEGEKCIGVGTLSAVEETIGTDGRITIFCRLVHTTPTELAPPRQTPVSFECVGADDQKLYRFRGLLRRKNRSAPPHPKRSELLTAASRQLADPQSPLAPSNCLSPAERKTDAVNAKTKKSNCERQKKRRQPEDTEAAIAELKWVNAMTEAGVDANIKMTTISLHTNESRATLERKLKQGLLPPPRIRGRLRYWSLKDVNAYLTGRWPPKPESGDTAGQ
ncbi:hypothetical protein SAMN06265795_102191 [Noviherbaspirillum humi]|uniref:Uncharacterized protein n=1 Tax=Noviherbaspirillum humi TaxID=1688639 RepID=A0A239DHB7_9BURK|nr:helix-turn-helix domain-containing protein [Noviherbaspirillum humi]SNS31885.1 hypothetical protein SAMN06265795_102191 [Noviherbaspirillum humi]